MTEVSPVLRENVILDKSKAFAVRIVRLYQYLREEKREYVLSKQLFRSGTSIGANARESVYAQSKADFYSKLHIALKEAGETAYWLELLSETGYLSEKHFQSIYSECEELTRLLTAITKHKNTAQE